MTEKQHWASSEELLEDYVLDRIDASLRQELRQHLASCHECRKLVEEETILAAGIRRTGAMEVKERLRTMIRGKEIDVPWPHILSMAAALFLIVGIGIYNRWFFRSLPPPPRHSTVENKRADTKEEERAREHDGPVHDEDLNEPLESARPQASGQQASGMKDDKLAQDELGFAASKSTMEQDSRSTVYALSGFILSGDAQLLSKMQAEGEIAEEAPAPGTRKKVGAVARDANEVTGNLVVHFAHRTEAAASEDPGTVQCSLEQVNDVYHLTVYLTAALTAADTSTVHARLATPDSLIVDLNGTLIGIALPDEVSGLIKP